ncbi:MAG: hypothetical protein IIB43_01935 [Candidatus Marinimicrobia bacterium]|nr:hypothetical protein [Candidatus Neomarinimicrobiota bacterium]
MGSLIIRDWNPEFDGAYPIPCDNDVEARGSLFFPEGKWIFLVLSEDAGLDLSPLEDLGPNDIQGLVIPATADDRAIEHIRGLLSLEQLILDDARITDSGLRHLRDLISLKELALRRTEWSCFPVLFSLGDPSTSSGQAFAPLRRSLS